MNGEPKTNPFIPISPGWRVALLGYLLLYRVLVPGLEGVLFESTSPLWEWRVLTSLLYQIVLMLPLLLYRRSWGWLHPLLFPVLFAAGSALLNNPETLLAPLELVRRASAESPFGGVERPLAHLALPGWGEAELARLYLKANVLQIFAVLVYYAGFFALRPRKTPRLPENASSYAEWKLLAAVAAAFLAFALFLDRQGGLEAHILRFASGVRFPDVAGPLIIFLKIAPTAVLIHFAVDRKAWRNPVVWIVALATASLGFLASGSRSSVFYVIISFVLVWMIRHGKMPALRVLVLGILFSISLSALGYIRQESRRVGSVEWSILLDVDRALEYAAVSESATGADESGYVAVLGEGTEVTGLLFGRTYLAAIFFWVPSSIWEGKPDGAGQLAGQRLFQSGGAGFPPGAVGEAYWNFHIPGVAISFLLFGLFHRWLAELLRRNPRAPAAWVLYVIILLYLPSGFDSVTIVNTIHRLFFAVVLLVWVGALGYRSPKEQFLKAGASERVRQGLYPEASIAGESPGVAEELR